MYSKCRLYLVDFKAGYSTSFPHFFPLLLTLTGKFRFLHFFDIRLFELVLQTRTRILTVNSKGFTNTMNENNLGGMNLFTF